jgi:hypothetical protein
MSEKKVVGRRVAIALGIICVILVVALAGVMANYTRIINDKDTLYTTTMLLTIIIQTQNMILYNLK